MIAVLVARCELQVPVQIQPRIAPGADASLRDHDVLILRTFCCDDRVSIHRLTSGHLKTVGIDQRGNQYRDHRDSGHTQHSEPGARQRLPKHHEDQEAAGDGVDEADDDRAAQLSEHGQQYEREAQPADECSDVVGGEQVGDRRTRLLLANTLQ